MQDRSLFLVACVVVLSISACGLPDTPGRNRAIETAIKPYGELAVTTGSHLNLRSDALAYFRKLEAAGLVQVREVPQDYWGGFATKTFMEGAKPYKVLATQKLFDTARDANLGGEAGSPSRDVDTCHVRVSDPKLGDILRDEEYKGPLATPGETFRLILARIKNDPNRSLTAASDELVKLLPTQLRCVVKYSDFKKEWSVVALDVGSSDPDRWYTSNVN